MARNHRQLGQGERFHFDCRPDLPCFTRCCANVNILLTETDVLRLSSHLKLGMVEFLDRYAWTLASDVVVLRQRDGLDRKCPFVGEDGCAVYEHRPRVCRMYPLAIGYPPVQVGVDPDSAYFCFEDDFCAGHREEREWTAESWCAEQSVS